LPSLSDLSDVSESSLPDPLPWDAVPSSRYSNLNRVQPYLADLRTSSAKRIQSDKGFMFLTQAIARVKKSLVNKSVSLNEKERRDEVEQDKQLERQIKNESHKLHAAQPQTYAISLANAGHPGLPAPTEAATEKAPAAAAKADHDKSNDEDALAADGEGHNAADEIVLAESERLLADYVRAASR
jgi:carboxyl-terminal processing protease